MSLAKAEHLFSKPVSRGDSGTVWRDDCRHETLSVFTDSEGMIVQITVAEGAVRRQTRMRGRRDAVIGSQATAWSSVIPRIA